MRTGTLILIYAYLLHACIAFPNKLKEIISSKNLTLEETSFKTDVKNFSTEIYEQLYRFSNFTAVSYCATPIHQAGIKEGPTFDCDLEFCKDNAHEYEIVKVLSPEKKKVIFGISGTGFIALSHTRKEVVVAFRGTMSIQDAITDISLVQVPYKPITEEAIDNYQCEHCRVHQGFYVQLLTTFCDVFPVVDKLLKKNPGYQLLVTGHSLGGAIAQLAGIEFNLMGYNPLIVGIAGPKVGNQYLSDYTDKLFGTKELDQKFRNGKITKLETGFWRLIQKQDYVPLVPPGQSYAHAGLEFAISTVKLMPQPQSDIVYSGVYKYDSFFKNIKWNEISVFDVFHIYQHLHYFVFQSSCLVDIILHKN